jgi:hypothetical protein
MPAALAQSEDDQPRRSDSAQETFAGSDNRGRSSGFRIVLLTAPSRVFTQWLCGVRSRLQRRDRNGFAPFSLFFPASNKLPEHLASAAAM